MTGKRKPIPSDVEARLLIETRRRCCLCVYLNDDQTQKQVQIAHISRSPNDSSYANLVPLCLAHHDEYDTRHSQSKGYTAAELKHYKDLLIRDIAAGTWGLPPTASESSVVVQKASDAPEPYIPVALVGPASGRPVPDSLISALTDPLRQSEAVRTLAALNILSDDISQINRLEISFRTSARLVLFVSNPMDWDWNMIVLTRQESQWAVLGAVSFPSQRGAKPRAEFVAGSQCDSLAIEHMSGTGSGIYLSEVTWFRLSDEGLCRLLHYPVVGYVSGWGMSFDRNFNGREIQRISQLESGKPLEIVFEAQYRMSSLAQQGEGDVLFSTTGKLVLRWEPRWKTFVRTGESTMTFDDVDGLFKDGHDQFLARHKDALCGIASHGTENQRTWLKGFLDDCTDSEAKEKIITELIKTQ